MTEEPYRIEKKPETPHRAHHGLASHDGVIRANLVCARCGAGLQGRRRSEPCPGCSRPIGDHVCERPSASDPTDDERTHMCTECGYDLRGLSRTGRCPECGTPIATAAAYDSLDEPLSRMPIHLIIEFRHACWFASTVMMCGIIALGWLLLGGGASAVVALILTAIGVAWAIAAHRLTPALTIQSGAVRGFSEGSRLRRAARQLQWAWPAAGALGFIAATLPANAFLTPVVPLALSMLCILVGLFGMASLALVLSRLAEWTRDDLAERAFDFSLWGLLLGGPPLMIADMLSVFDVVLPESFAMIGRFSLLVGVLLLLVWLSGLLAFPLGLFSLTKSVTLSVQHAHEYNEWMARRRDREEAGNRSLDDRLSAMDQSHARRSS